MPAAAILFAAAVLGPVIADPVRGPSDWALVVAGGPAPPAVGYLLELPSPSRMSWQTWLENAVSLASRGAPVVAIGPAPPPAEVLPYLDGVCVDPVPHRNGLPAVLGTLGDVPLVLRAEDLAAAVDALSGGATAVLLPTPAAVLAPELHGLLPEPVPARGPRGALPTALRSADLATVVGLPRGFPGGGVTLSSERHGPAALITADTTPVAVRSQPGEAVAIVPPLVDGGLLVVRRPAGEAGAAFENLAVTGERLPSAAEVLARHQRAAARQARLLPRWRATQRLLLRVWVADLTRSFEVVLEGPAFFEHGIGTDWEIVHAAVDGVAWNPDALPDLPLLEPSRPAVPPLALRLNPAYHYELRGSEMRDGRRCWELAFTDIAVRGSALRRGTAWIDAASFGLVELDELAERLPGEVRSSNTRTTYREVDLGGEAASLPVHVVADDLVAAFGTTTTVHRDLTLDGFELTDRDFATRRATAWAGPHRMLRDTAAGIVPLVPDGHGGRIAGAGARAAERFLLAGVVWDPGLSFPVPFGGIQIQDFDFRGRGEQLRLLVAGVVNDGAWSVPGRHGELTLRASTQLLSFTNTSFVRGREVKGEEIEVRRQRLGAGAARTVGTTRLLVDLGIDRWDFGRTDNTASSFVLPPSTFEGVVKLEAASALASTTLSISAEAGRRQDWRAWGIDAEERPERAWQRERLAVVWEKAPFPLAKLHLGAELWVGSHLDRFSAPSPARFGGVRIRGIATGRVIADRLGVVRASLAVPLSALVRGEAGVDVAWVRDDRSGYRARPLSGIGAGISAPGPWGTLLEATVGVPLATPGPRAPAVDVFLLRPLAGGH